MRIDDVSVVLFNWENVAPARYHGPAVTPTASDLGWLRVRTDDGVEGHAFLGSSQNPASMDAPMLVRWLKPLLMGEDPLARERIHEQMRKVSRLVGYRTIGAVDVALWDLAAKAAGMPLHALLGSYRTAIPAYVSSQRFPGVEQYVAQASELKADGWLAYKIHPPTQPALDIAVCEAVREAVGDGYPLMLDSTWSYRYPDALRVGRAIERMDYYWYEDPLADMDVYNYVKLSQKLEIPLMATEYPAAGLDSYPVWLIERATDFLRGDIPNKGGITTMLKTAHLAEAFGLRYEIHHSGNSLNNVANLHVAVALNNCEYFEVLQPAGAHKYGLVRDLDIDGDGLMHAPSGAGLGVEVDVDLITTTATGTLT